MCRSTLHVQGTYDDSNLGSLKPRFQLSVVRSSCRLTYAQAQAMMEMSQPVGVTVFPPHTLADVGGLPG